MLASLLMAKVAFVMNKFIYIFPISQVLIMILFTILMIIAATPILREEKYWLFKGYSIIAFVLYFYAYSVYEVRDLFEENPYIEIEGLTNNDYINGLTISQYIDIKFEIVKLTSFDIYDLSSPKSVAEGVIVGPKNTSGFSFFGNLFFLIDFVIVPIFIFIITYKFVKPHSILKS